MPKIVEVESDYWDKELLLQEMPSGRSMVKVSFCTKDDRDWLSIREWFLNKDGEHCPSRHGLAIRVETVETLDSLIGAITLAKTCME